MNKQEIFDTVVEHLLSMKGPSIDYIGRCAYRGKDGSKCAVGVLIPDEIYDPEMEGLPILLLCDRLKKFKLPEWILENRYFLLDLQRYHDNYLNWGDEGPNKHMIKLLKGIAVEYNLTSSIINKKWNNRFF